MNCYRCGGTLDLSRDTCPKCGTDVRFFKKIVYMSNRYYNDGLMKAEAKDLTGAKESLKTSLSLYKKNTNARNLLGLVYYATGESAEALKMWVISKNYEPEKNMCDRYMNLIRRNMNSLDSEDHGIKKFNQALNYAKNDARDLAVIQLKKVVSVHPNMTKAYELLALLYMEDGKLEQARRVLNNCLNVDRGNTRALYYLKELDQMENGSGLRSVGTVGEEDREQLIIPVRFRDFGSYLANALYILAGVLLGIAIAWFVIVPGKVQKQMSDASSEALSYEAVISQLQQEVLDASRRESENARVSEEDESMSEDEERSRESSEEAAESSIAEEREAFPFIKKLTSYARNNEAVSRAGGMNNPEHWADFIRLFLSIDPTLLSDDSLILYNVEAEVLCNATNREDYITEAEELLASRKYEEGSDLYDALSYLMPESDEIRFRTGEAFELARENEKAANFYWQYYWLFPDGERREEALNKYLALLEKEEIDPWSEDINPEEMVQPVLYDELIEGLQIPETEPPEPETPSPEESPEQNPEENPEQSPEENPEENPEQSPEENPEENTEPEPEENPEDNPEQNPEEP